MTAVRRVWCPQDAQDAWVAAQALHAKGFPVNRSGGVLPDLPPLQPLPASSVAQSRVLCDYMVTFAEDQHGITLSGLAVDPMPVSRVPGRTRGRHRARRHSLRVTDIDGGAQ